MSMGTNPVSSQVVPMWTAIRIDAVEAVCAAPPDGRSTEWTWQTIHLERGVIACDNTSRFAVVHCSGQGRV